MRDIAAERMIERRMVTRFDLDTARLDVTVINREATISGILVNKTRQKPLEKQEANELRRYFSPDRLDGVDRVYFNLRGEGFTM